MRIQSILLLRYQRVLTIRVQFACSDRIAEFFVRGNGFVVIVSFGFVLGISLRGK